MKATSNSLRWTGIALLALAAAAGAFAFTFVLNQNTKLPIKWPAGSVNLRILLGDTKALADGSNYNTSARAAAQAWNDLLGSAQFQSNLVAGSAGTSGDNNDLNELAFSDKIFGRDFDENTLAVTTGYSIGNERVEADITFNTAYTWDSYRGNTRPGSYDIRRVALHELGHLLGLDHPDEADPKQTVNAIMNSRIGNLESLTSDDSQGGQSLYGPPGAPVNDTFANATVITLTSGNSTSLKGYNTNATREPSEPLNAGNAGGRSVWWRWTAPSNGAVTLDTKGSYYDTTLGVYTGNTVGGLTQIASDDDIEDGVIQATELNFSVTAGTTYRFSVDGFNGDASGADNGGITLNLNFSSVGGTLPSITTQPAGATVNSGERAQFSVTATGTEPLTYQWRLNDVVIAGATSASYVISSVTTAQAGNYSVVVTNAAGSVTSNNAALTVNGPTPPPAPPPPSSGGGGGGGAPSPWFYAALAALGLLRRLVQSGTPPASS